ncbi:MAG: MlaD family protein [Gammaproteobacteria bacterium]
MEPKVNYALVGLFVVLLGGALIGGSLWLATGSLRQTYDPYYIFINESVSGLNNDAPVKYRGVAVGRVRQIELAPGNPEQVRLTVEIRHGTPVKENTVASLRLQGLTGIAYVELSGGTRDAPPLTATAGHRIPVIRSEPSFLARLDSNFSELLNNVTSMSRELADLLNGPNRKAIGQTLQHVETVTANLARQTDTLDRALGNAASTLQHTATATAGLDKTFRSIGQSAASLQRMSDTLAHTADGLSKTLQTTSPGLEQFTDTTLPEVQGLVVDLRRLVANLQQTSDALRRDPRSLLFGRQPAPLGPGE